MSTPATSNLAYPSVVVDTSAWASRILPQDSNHIAARNWIDNYLLSGGVLIAPLLIVTEVAAAVSRRTGLVPLAHAAANQLYATPNIRLEPLDQQLIGSATSLAANLGIRGADALFVALAAQLGIPLVTFDKEQLTKPVGTIVTIRP